jgi:hypothetical protein
MKITLLAHGARSKTLILLAGGRAPIEEQLRVQAVQLIGVRCPAVAFSLPSKERYRKAMRS